MSVNLQKGQKVDLTKGNTGLKTILVGLGWDEAPRKFSLFSKHEDIDCDASALLISAQTGKLNGPVDVVYFGNLTHQTGAVHHMGDNLTGAGDGDDEQIMVDLPNIPANIDKLVFVVNIYDANVRHQHFGLIRNAFIRLVDLSTQKEICRFNLSDDYSGRTGLVVGEIYRHNGEWKFNAIGQGVTEASRLAELVRLYQ